MPSQSGDKVLILGGSGMIGHVLARRCATEFETWCTAREDTNKLLEKSLISARGNCSIPLARVLLDVDANRFSTIEHVFDLVEPTVVVNCIGVVKQLAAASDPIESISINSLFPHLLARLARARQCRVITLSTDCVFSGLRGNYSEDDHADPVDFYGRSKLLGELSEAEGLTIRTSIIGKQLGRAHGLIEWFLSQSGGRIQGYKQSVFSGFTTECLSEIILQIIGKFPDLSGIYHIASQPISKARLLQLLREALSIEIEIEEVDGPSIDRSLNGNKFYSRTKIIAPGWQEQIAGLAREINGQSSAGARC
jgi:dTDP-4-dehydrorhamnose reductase